VGRNPRWVPRSFKKTKLVRGVSWRVFRSLLLFASFLMIFVNLPLPASACHATHPSISQAACTPVFSILGSLSVPNLFQKPGYASCTVDALPWVPVDAIAGVGRCATILNANSVPSYEWAATLRHWVNLFGDALFLVSLAIPNFAPAGKIEVRATPIQCAFGEARRRPVEPSLNSMHK
jgi:hypothetical protein